MQKMNNWKVSRRGLLLGALALTASGCASGGWQGAYPFAGGFRVDPRFRRQRVRYEGTERPGTIVVDISQRFLFAVEDKRLGDTLRRCRRQGGTYLQRQSDHW